MLCWDPLQNLEYCTHCRKHKNLFIVCVLITHDKHSVWCLTWPSWQDCHGHRGPPGTRRRCWSSNRWGRPGKCWYLRYQQTVSHTKKTYSVFYFAINFAIRGVVRELIHFPLSDVDLFLQVFRVTNNIWWQNKRIKSCEKFSILASPLLVTSENKIINVRRQIILQNEKVKWEDCFILHAYCALICAGVHL